ncbi:hypothetical protein BBJ28_00021289 [Nothophytophthora sp. Chile5]|nr:hypothetical protein BBJ28_00021289 [Nothophytophthora sp. Chile5]
MPRLHQTLFPVQTQAPLPRVRCSYLQQLRTLPSHWYPSSARVHFLRGLPLAGESAVHGPHGTEISPNPWLEPPFPEDEQERLAAVRKLNTRDLSLSGKFDMFCEVAAKTMKCPISYVSLMDDKQLLLLASVGMAHTTLPRELSFCAHTICHTMVLVVLDTQNDERFRENHMAMGDKAKKIRYYVGASIFTRDGHALGTVAVMDTKPRRKADQEHIGVLQHLGFLASGMITRSAESIYEG